MISSALIWLILYLLLIPLFAFVYCFCLKDDFRHINVKFDSNFIEHMASLRTQLLFEIKKDIKEFHKSDTIYLEENLLIDLNSVFLTDLKIHNSELTAGLIYSIEQNFNQSIKKASNIHFTNIAQVKKYIESLMKNPNIIHLCISISQYSVKSKKERRLIEVKDGCTDNVENYPIIFRKGTFINEDKDTTILFISSKLSKMIKTAINSHDGFPNDLDGSLTRMFHLSASTVTTLGISDIYPITTIARFILTLESLFGMMFIGLFFYKIGKAK